MNKFDMAAASAMNTSTTTAATAVDGGYAARINLEAFQASSLSAKAPRPPVGGDDNV